MTQMNLIKLLRRTSLLFSTLFVMPWTQVMSADTPYIAVGKARARKVVLAFPSLQSQGPGAESAAKQIFTTFQTDIQFMEFARFLPEPAFPEKPQTGAVAFPPVRMSDWQSVGADFLLKAGLSKTEGNYALEFHLYDVKGSKEVLARRLLGAPNDIKTMAHTLANQVVEALTGQPGIFLTKIVMSCDRTGHKELYMMNIDGSEIKQLTSHRSIAFSPNWSPDNTKIVYSVYSRNRQNIKNIDLYEFNFINSTVRMISNRRGINSGASYSPDGQTLVLTMSFLGDPEIFLLDPKSLQAKRLTKSIGVDVDPIWSPDGTEVAFVSSRTGSSMIFKMKADGSGIQRLTFAGQYNATPSWSPQGNKIVFAGWIDHSFDIFIMNSDGTTIERLSKNQGNNEDPFFSPDGNFITFSSNRTGQKNIYVMNTDGTLVRRLTYGMGNCVSPKWSNVTKPTTPVPASPSGSRSAGILSTPVLAAQ